VLAPPLRFRLYLFLMFFVADLEEYTYPQEEYVYTQDPRMSNDVYSGLLLKFLSSSCFCHFSSFC